MIVCLNSCRRVARDVVTGCVVITLAGRIGVRGVGCDPGSATASALAVAAMPAVHRVVVWVKVMLRTLSPHRFTFAARFFHAVMEAPVASARGRDGVPDTRTAGRERRSRCAAAPSGQASSGAGDAGA